MLKKQPGIFLALLLVLVPAAVFSKAAAQDMPPGKWWRNSRVVGELKLTEAQVTQLDLTYQNRYRELLRHKSNVEKERFELETLMEDKGMDETSANAQYKKLEEARNALGSERFQFILEIRKIIGNDKFFQLKSIYSRTRKNRPNYEKDHGMFNK